LEKTNAKIRAKMVWANPVSTDCGLIKIDLWPKSELLYNPIYKNNRHLYIKTESGLHFF